MTRVLPIAAATFLAPAPALAVSGPFFSLYNTNFVMWLGLLVFVAILLYYRVPRTLTRLLDKRAEGIKSDLAEARALRDEAQSLLASFERKQKEVEDQAKRIVSSAREDARTRAERAEADMDRQMERRLETAREQIAAAEEQAIREVRNRAVSVASDAARKVLLDQMSGERASRLIDDSIGTVDRKLH